MVIICLIICNNVGKMIFARQFVSLFSKQDLFHQTNIFIKNYSPDSQLKYLDLPPYRYSYQLLSEKLILLLISKLKNNNIILEQETLKICYRLIQQRIGIDINETLIKNEGLNLAIDLEEIVQNGLVQNLKFGEINSNINMIRVDKEEKKKKYEKELNKLKNNMNKQFDEMEKMEKLNNNDKNLMEINFDLNNNLENKNQNMKNIFNNNEKHINHDTIKLNYKFDIIQIKKPIEFRTPSGKVIKLAEQKKAVEKRKDKDIKGIKLEKNK